MIEHSHASVPYDDLDDNMLLLVRTLNRLPGLETISSCGGHTRPKLELGQWRAGTWYVQFVLHPTPEGWLTLEFLAWAVNVAYRSAERHALFLPKSPAPHEHGPGEVLSFFIEGYTATSADELAEFLTSVRDFYGQAPAASTEG